MPITYLTGDATLPQKEGQKILCHVVNTEGGWGAGFVLAASKRWPEPEQRYQQWMKDTGGPVLARRQLGLIQTVPVTDDITVVNMLCQLGYRYTERRPLRYGHLAACLVYVAEYMSDHTPRSSVHMPRIGAGLAGGDWDVIESIIEDILVFRGVDVFVYDLP